MASSTTDTEEEERGSCSIFNGIVEGSFSEEGMSSIIGLSFGCCSVTVDSGV